MRSHDVENLRRSWAGTHRQPLNERTTRLLLTELQQCLSERERLVALVDELRAGPWPAAQQLLGDQAHTSPWLDVRRLLGELHRTLQRTSEAP